jgi:hypothetical protein
MPEPSQPELWDGNEISEILLAFGIAIPMKLWHCVVLKEVRQLDEKLLDLLDMALAERFQLSYAALRESDPQSEKLVQELMSLSDSIQNSFEISQGIKDRIEYYLSQNSDLEVTFQKHLYIQGAKDCVAVLRELGVIQ